MNKAYAGLVPTELWRHFDALNRIPRQSGSESAARAYVQREADKAGCKWRTDEAGNCVVYVPSRSASEVPLRQRGFSVAVQAHLDMVKATAPGVVHDFEKDPIVPKRDSDRIFASGTTLGADNGIGAAACLALITDRTLATGPLEILFTVEEETGLVGASSLDGSLLTAKSLINLDSEDPETLTIGCAGGETVKIAFPFATEPIPDDWQTFEISVGGLRGGHSGVDIHRGHANAIKLLTLVLGAISNRTDYRLAGISGGSAHNAIPRDASALVALPPSSRFLSSDSHAAESLAEVVGESGFRIDIAPVTGPVDFALARSDSDRLIDLLAAIPTGVLYMSEVFDNKVQTSDNLATVRTMDEAVEIVVSIRSFVGHEIEDVRARIQTTAKSAGASTEIASAYPHWNPDPHSSLLKITSEAFRDLTGADPIVEVVHAGLECGVISAKVPGILPRSASTPTASKRPGDCSSKCWGGWRGRDSRAERPDCPAGGPLG
jgi:dipeptidase D